MNAETVRHIELPGAVSRHGQSGGIAAVIGVAQRDDVVIARVSPRHEQREVVGLRPGIDEIADLQIARHLRRQLRAYSLDVGMQINRRRVLERFVLPPRGLDDVRMAMSDADRDDAAESIEIALARLIPDILHPALDEHERLLVVEKNSGIEKFLPKRENLVSGGTRVGVGLKRKWRKGNFFHHLQ